jgi:hypothetical protein
MFPATFFAAKPLMFGLRKKPVTALRAPSKTVEHVLIQ